MSWIRRTRRLSCGRPDLRWRLPVQEERFEISARIGPGLCMATRCASGQRCLTVAWEGDVPALLRQVRAAVAQARDPACRAEGRDLPAYLVRNAEGIANLVRLEATGPRIPPAACRSFC